LIYELASCFFSPMKNSDLLGSQIKELSALREWMQANLSTSVPKDLANPFSEMLNFLDLMTKPKSEGRALTRHFLRAIGILPKSEKRNIGIGPLTKERKVSLEHLSRFVLNKIFAKKRNKLPLEAVLDPKEGHMEMNSREAEIVANNFDKAEGCPSQEEFNAQNETDLGCKSDSDPICVSLPSSENLFSAHEEGFVCANSEEFCLSEEEIASIKETDNDTVSLIKKTHKRVGFQLVVEETEVTVETAFNRNSMKSVRASTSQIGPTGTQITWNGLVSLISMMVVYLIPAHRISVMLGAIGSYFTRSRCVKHLKYVARRLLPVHLAQVELLARAEVLQTDDTSCRCPEAKRAIKKLAEDSNFTLPWNDWHQKSQEGANPPNNESPLSKTLAWELGFENENKGGGSRTKFNTTVVIGKSDPSDLKSFIVLFHSHFGQAGDVIARLYEERLKQRPPTPGQKETVFLVSDLLSTNQPTNKSLYDKFDIKSAGCMHHARRNFVIHKEDDLINCTEIEWAFSSMSHYESQLTERGRRKGNVMAVRQNIISSMWEFVQMQSEELAERWPKGTPIGRAARYVINHFDRLTLYLKYPQLPDNNSLSERMLRPEKLMEKSSLFRWSLEGRAAWNILRGLAQTCSLGQLDFKAYLNFVLRSPDLEVQKSPHSFTPQAFAKSLKKN
jgi:hypothetical protein